MKNLIIALSLLIATIAIADTTFVPAGPVSGVWDSTGSPFIIQGNIYVPNIDTLLIESGTKVLFDGRYTFSIGSYSVFRCKGSLTDSVLITAIDTIAGWRSLILNGSAPSCSLRYTCIEFGINGPSAGNVELRNGRLYINNSRIRKGYRTGSYSNRYYGGIYCYNAILYIAESRFEANAQAIISSDSEIYINKSDFIANITAGSGGSGAAIDGSNLIIDSCYFGYNYASNLGGAIHGGRNSRITNSIFEFNSAYGYAINAGGGALSLSGENILIKDCIFENNHVENNYGGAIYTSGHIDSIISCSFSNNDGNEKGGAIAFNDGSGIIKSCSFSDNFADECGGAIWARGSGWFIVYDSEFLGNTANKGGCFYTEEPCSISNSTISNNSAILYGGAIFGPCFVSRSIIDSNSAGISGGSIYSESDIVNMGKCQLSNNSAGWYGGAIYQESGEGTYNNCIFENQNAPQGGFFASEGGESNFINCTIENSSATTSGGGFWFDSGSEAKVTVFNTIIDGVTAPSGELASDDGGTDSLIFINSYYDTTLSVDGTGLTIICDGCLCEAPVFVGTGDNPWALVYDSPGIDAGLHSTTAYGGFTASDDDILGRSRPANDKVDIGAYEYPKISVVAYDSATSAPMESVTVDWRPVGGTWTSELTGPSGEVRIDPDTTLSYEIEISRTDYVCRPSDTVISPSNLPVTIAVEVAPFTMYPDMVLGTTSLDFGDVLMHNDSTRTINISNDGGVDLTVYGTSTTSSQFTSTTGSLPIHPDSSHSINVTFTPDSNLVYEETLWVYSNDDTQFVELIGHGLLPPRIWLSDTIIDFGDTLIPGSFVQKTIHVSNIGEYPLPLDTIYISSTSSAFSTMYTSLPTIAPDSSWAFIIGFVPPFEASYSGTLYVCSVWDTATALISGSATGIEENSDLPQAFSLNTYPNPFNGSCVFHVGIPNSSLLEIQIIDIEGRILSSYSEGPLNAGYYKFDWQPKPSVGSGIYLVRTKIGDKDITKRVVYLK